MAEAYELLKLIDAEFRTDPMSVQCFDLRVVQRVRECIEEGIYNASRASSRSQRSLA